jgi:serine/threonine protein kinase
MGKYLMSEAPDDKLGEGTYCVCRRGTILDTGEQVAIKVCKLVRERGTGDEAEQAMLKRFRRQVMVLQELHQPFVPPADPSLWNEELAGENPADMFVRMLDYSKDRRGEPGPEDGDGWLYVVLELAQHSLKAFLRAHRDQKKLLNKEAARSIARRIILVVAALHAKGLVHLDFKPDNLMMFGNNWKLIDVDGCVRAGTSARLEETAIYYSPCYCAPEMARFLTQVTKGPISILPSLDVWSVGMVTCELAHLDAVLKPRYAIESKKAHSHRHACRKFLDWLGGTECVDFLPRDVEEFDEGLRELVFDYLLVLDGSKRKSLAQCLTAPYIAEAARTEPLPDALREVLPGQMAAQLEELCAAKGLTLYARPSTPRQLTPRGQTDGQLTPRGHTGGFSPAATPTTSPRFPTRSPRGHV